MALLGNAAMLLSFDVAPDAIDEHDDWHTHEHLPERLSIPGFVRGTRWVAPEGRPRYFVMYEVDEVATLASAPYLERLNNPTPWTSKMMTHYRGMTRGFCTIAGSFGTGVGHAALVVRFRPAPDKETGMREWLLSDELPKLPSQAGLASAHVFEAALTPPSTNEQRIRGSDATMALALVVTGYSAERVTDVLRSRFSEQQLAVQGAREYVGGVYRREYSLTRSEIA